jgi:hypothetical protein
MSVFFSAVEQGRVIVYSWKRWSQGMRNELYLKSKSAPREKEEEGSCMFSDPQKQNRISCISEALLSA